MKNFLIWIIIFLFFIAVFGLFTGPNTKGSIKFSQFISEVENGQIQDVTIRGNNITGHYASDGSNFSTYAPDYPDLFKTLHDAGVDVNAVPLEDGMTTLFTFLLSWFPIFLIIAVWIFFMRQMQGGKGGGGAMGFGKSKARLLTEKQGIVTFADVSGVEEAKEELVELVDYLKDPGKFMKLGAKIPRGCLLVGPPGTGKTLLARAIAGEAGVPFFTISGSDFVEMFVGVGASRVRDMFEQGKKNSPCIIFIDEIDAVGRHRGAGLGGGNDEREQTLNQLLVEMDGFEKDSGVIILAATNRPDVLDPALLRPGRFDRQIVVPLPDIKGREDILNIHLQKVPQAPDVDAKIIARGTPGFSGADLANLVNEAALLAARRNKKVITMPDLEEAKDKVMMGAERKSMVMGEEEKKLTAYHEAGHALVGIHLPACDPIHKATIIPRGRALGMVMRLPEKDQLSVTREKLKADIAMGMGGRVAEELIFGYDKVTSGASSDIQYVTNMAKNMVAKWGMSDKIGPVFHGGDNEEVFLGYSIGKGNHVSEETANLIDEETKGLVEAGEKLARKILEEHMDELHNLANALLEYETLSGDEITDLLAGKKIRQASNDNSKKSSKPPASAVPKTGSKKPRKKSTAKKKDDAGGEGDAPQGA